MTSRSIALLGCGLALAVACGSDDGNVKQPPVDGPSGAGGEAGAPATNGGAPPLPVAGASGGPDKGGGAASSVGGAGAEPSVAGAPSGGAGEDSNGPGSACDTGQYETGEGCAACPALPTPNDPNVLDCQDHTRSYFNTGDLVLEISFAQAPFHEPASGETTITWTSPDVATDGSAVVPWTYSPGDEKFVFQLPIEARYSDRWSLDGWTFADTCGFLFSATNLVIDYDGEAFTCDPT